jgi:hypothetical protein
MYKLFNLFLTVALTFVVSTSFCATNTATMHYNLPNTIELKIVEKAQAFGKSIRMSASLQSKLVRLKNLKIFFNSSRDIKIISTTKNISLLEPNELETINIIAIKTGESADKLGSWIRIGVSYTPDYDALIKLASDPIAFPVDAMRNKLIADLTENQAANEPYLDALRHFIKK